MEETCQDRTVLGLQGLLVDIHNFNKAMTQGSFHLIVIPTFHYSKRHNTPPCGSLFPRIKLEFTTHSFHTQ